VTRENCGRIVGVLHPGQMGAAVAAQARARGVTVLWCPEGRGSRTSQRATDAGLDPVGLVELLDRAEVVLSVCPPGQTSLRFPRFSLRRP